MKFPVISTEKDYDAHYKSDIWLEAAKQICERHAISYSELKRAEYSEHVIFFIDDAFIVKIFAPFRQGFEREKAGLEFASGKTSLKIPEIIAAVSLKISIIW